MAKRWAHKYEYSAQIEQRAFNEAIREATKLAKIALDIYKICKKRSQLASFC